MKTFLRTIIFISLFHFVLYAEKWPSLKEYVSDCVLIIKARTIYPGERMTAGFEILETWKGNYHSKLLKNSTSPGTFYTSVGKNGVNVVDGQEIVFFFTRHNNPKAGPLANHSTAIPINNGKIVYAPSSSDHRNEYSLKEFKKTILELSKIEKLTNHKNEIKLDRKTESELQSL